MKPFAINEKGIKIYAIKEGKVKWQKRYGKMNISSVKYDSKGELSESAYFNAYGTKQYLVNFYKIK